MYIIEKDGEKVRTNNLEVYEGWTVIGEEPNERPHDFYSMIEGTWQEDINAVEEHCLETIERQAEEASLGDIRKLRRQIAVMLLWSEVQRLKLASATGNIPTNVLERAKQFPTLMALVQQSGNTLAQVATAAENRLWDRVRRMALWEAKLMLANDAVRAATTAIGKLDKINQVTWDE